MPAANSIPNHPRYENSGFASGPPSRTLPTGRNTSSRAKRTNTLPADRKNQSKALVIAGSSQLKNRAA